MRPDLLRVSVVVPTFKRKFLLEQTLTGLLRQELAPIEVSVMDDGSQNR